MSSELTDALNRILRWTEQHKPKYVEYLYPGLSKDEIDGLVQDLPIQFSPELYELYQWRNGVLDVAQEGDDEWKDTAWLFHSWTFRPLQEVVAGLRQKSLGNQTHQTVKITDISLINPYFKRFYYLSIFYHILWHDDGFVLINNTLNFCPVIFERFEEGELTVLEKYTSLTSMMLTIAECYETGVYFIGDYICRNPEKEYQIWRKYNFQIIEFALQAIQKGSLCGRFFIYFFNDLMEFKDPRVVEPLIQGLQLLNHQNADRYSHIKDDPFLYFDPKAEVAKILGELGDARAVPVLIATLKDEGHNNWDYNTKVSAANALGQIKDEQATYPLIDALIEALEDSEIEDQQMGTWALKEIRRMAVWALSEIGDLRAAETLIEALRDTEREVRETASEALIKLISKFPELDERIPF